MRTRMGKYGIEMEIAMEIKRMRMRTKIRGQG